MNAKLLVFLSFALLTIERSPAQTPVWTQMPGSPSGNTRHDDIYFINETNGWSARGRDGIYKTSDGGSTWTQTLNKPNTHFRAIGFVSELRGFAGNLGVGSYDINVSDTNVLYQTDDGGETWSVVPGLNESGMKGFCALYVLDSQHIFGGGRVRGPAHFAKSEDGGTNWTVVDLKAAGIMGGIMDVYFKDPMNGFVVGMDTNDFFGACGGNYHGRIAKTSDGGATWTAVADTGIACSYFWKMSWPTPDVGYVSLQQNGSSSNLIFYKTIDGGSTWSSNGIPYATIGIPSFTLLQGIGFVSATEGWVGGPVGTSPYANNFLHTIDGGASWAPAGYNDSRSINRIRFNGNFGVASGAKLHIFRVPPIVALSIKTEPQSLTVGIGSAAAFNVSADGTAPLNFQWRFNGTNIFNATNTILSFTNTQLEDAGDYSVIVTNFAGSATSAVATLTVVLTNEVLFCDNFDDYDSPIVVTNIGFTNGYRIVYRSTSSVKDFAAIFGFDYSTVTYPTGNPPAPHSSGGTTKGLFLTVNKDANGAVGAVNLYPTNQFFSGDFALKFDMWINWANPLTSTEHAMFGINHSGNVTNRVTQTPSDGLFFEVNGEGGSTAGATTLRDFSVLRGGGSSTPILMTTSNTTFGPAPLVAQYTNTFAYTNGTILLGYDDEFSSIDRGSWIYFHSQNIPGFGPTPAGTVGLRWVSGEVRQKNNLITWLLNGTIVAQYTNTFAYTNGTILLGYDDEFSSIGDANNFVIFDNVRVEPVITSPVALVSPNISGNEFNFGFVTESYENYIVQIATNLTVPDWIEYTNIIGNGLLNTIRFPLTNNVSEKYFRVVRP